MKAIIIEEIKTTEQEFPDQRPDFKRLKYTGLANMAFKDGELPTAPAQFEEEVFNLHKVYDGVSTVRNYFVRYDQKGMFSELVSISEDTIQKRINKELGMRKDMIYEAEEKLVMKIKKLPWYKRLFNRFDL
jgi:hypothetical protein